ncbi:MAG: hypothetical protein Kow00129_07680 [Thermoleophilia bacterium]
MKLRELYEIMVREGVKHDPRGEAGTDYVLELSRKEYEELPEDRRWEFDAERLENPFTDTRILNGDPETEIRRALVGIDMGVAEVVLADRLRERGEIIDLLVAHHPEGRALADLPEVMRLQADVWKRQGVPVSFGDAVISDRMREVLRWFHSSNTEQSLSAARLLDFPFICCHTPSDNAVTSFLQSRMDGLPDEARVKDVLSNLKEIPEYRTAVLQGTGPTLYAGDEDRRAGKIMVDMTGGTEGPKDALERLAQAGVGTIVGMHMSDEHRKRADELKLNVVIAGHMASDSLGMNLILDEWERAGVEVASVSGFIRHSRVGPAVQE